MLPSASWAQDPGEPDLSAFTPQQQALMQAACRVDGYSGPAALYACLRTQVTALRNSPGEPDLSAFTTQQQALMRAACRVDGYSGPAALYACLRTQVTAVRSSPGEPDLSAFTPQQQALMRAACRVDGYSGPAALYRCLRAQVTALRNFPDEPDLSAFTPQQQTSMRAACRVDGYSGPAALYRCLQRQAAALLDVIPRTQPLSHGPQATGSLPVPTTDHPQVAPKELPATLSGPPSVATRTTPAPHQNDNDGWAVYGLLIVFGLIWLFGKRRRTFPCRKCQSPSAAQGGLCRNCEQAEAAERRRREQAAREQAAREAEQARQRAEEERLRSLRTMANLHALSGTEFEDVVAKLFARLDCQVTRTPGSGDEGVDLVLRIDGVKLVVQCKRWKADIGAPVIRDFLGALMHSGAAHGFIITTASFTRSSADFARNKPLTLINGILLLKWLAGTYQPKVCGYAHQDTGGKRASQSDPGLRDPYDVLGIRKGATRDEIKAAYRREIARYHPDKVAQLGPELQELANAKSKQINEAYRVLVGGHA